MISVSIHACMLARSKEWVRRHDGHLGREGTQTLACMCTKTVKEESSLQRGETTGLEALRALTILYVGLGCSALPPIAGCAAASCNELASSSLPDHQA